MARKKTTRPKKQPGKHSSPATAGEQNLPKGFDEKHKDAILDDSLDNLLEVYKHGIKRRNEWMKKIGVQKGENLYDYEGQWDEESLTEEIMRYFNYCARKGLKPYKGGLCLWLAMSESTYYEWRNKPEKYSYKSMLIRHAEQIMEGQYVSRAEKYPTANLFLLRTKFGYTEASKIDITTNNKDINNADDVKEALKRLGMAEVAKKDE